MHVALEYLKLKPYALLSFDNSRVSGECKLNCVKLQ